MLHNMCLTSRFFLVGVQNCFFSVTETLKIIATILWVAVAKIQIYIEMRKDLECRMITRYLCLLFSTTKMLVYIKAWEASMRYTQGFAYLRFHFSKVRTTSRGARPAVKIRQKAATDEPIIHSSKWTRFSFFLKRKKFPPYKFHNTQIKGISLLNESLKNGARLENH